MARYRGQARARERKKSKKEGKSLVTGRGMARKGAYLPSVPASTASCQRPRVQGSGKGSPPPCPKRFSCLAVRARQFARGRLALPVRLSMVSL